MDKTSKQVTKKSTKKRLGTKSSQAAETDEETSNAENTCNNHVFSSQDKEFLQSNLLDWFDKNQRKLPWRDIAKSELDDDKRGYSVWVSEVMLQQTQVATVIPYYNKWLLKWPTVNDLAAANLEEVNQVWAGLGYYSRAKRLHEGAVFIRDSCNSHLPQTADDLKAKIPGIGRYTASAIASVAYNQVVGVVDGNVSRVLSRLRMIGSDISKQSTSKHFWQLADNIVPESRPGDFNQALMEFGAVLCTPRNPKCNSCPLKEICMAYALSEKSKQKSSLWKSVKCNGSSSQAEIDIRDIESLPGCTLCLPKEVLISSLDVTVFPVKAPKKKSRVECISVIVIERNSKEVLMVQRPDTGLLAGLWEFPSVLVEEENPTSDCAAVSDFLKGLGIPLKISKSRVNVGEVLHIFSHIRATYSVDYLPVNSKFEVADSKQMTKWLSREEFLSAAVSTAMKKVLDKVDKFISNASKEVCSNKKRKRSTSVSRKQKTLKDFFT